MHWKKIKKRFWCDLNILLDPTKAKKNEISLLDEDNNLICPSNITDLLNTYYAELGDNDAQSNQMYIDVASYKRDTNLSEIAEDTLEEISHIIKSINIYKPSGIQNIPTRILKQLFMHKPELLMILFNKSLQTTVFPESWKIGIVSLIPKQGNLLQMSNWRPITILPLPGKLLEKCIHKRLVEYFNENNLISEKQYGFQANKSTMQAVMELTKYLYEKRDIGNTTFNARTNDHCDLYTPDGCIGRTNSYKYLGVWLDSSLSMDKHLNNGYKMAYQKVFKLKKVEETNEHKDCNACL